MQKYSSPALYSFGIRVERLSGDGDHTVAAGMAKVSCNGQRWIRRTARGVWSSDSRHSSVSRSSLACPSGLAEWFIAKTPSIDEICDVAFAPDNHI
jgi:hypothetical protein